MGRFAYTALAADGQTVTGVIDSPSHAAAIAQLQAGGLLPIEARQATAAPDAGTRTRSRARASTEDIALFARQTGRMLAAGLPLDVALGIVGGLVRKRGSRAVFAAVLARVRDGDGLGRALAAQRGFPDNLVAMVTAAEQAGMLAPVLDRAGTFLDRTAAMRRRVAASRPGARIEGFLIAPQLSGGVEVLAGTQSDPVFGPVLTVGAGGVLTELVQDVCVRLAPVDEAGALQMLRSTRLARLLDGWRGAPPVDLQSLARQLALLSEIAWANRACVSAIELNPIVARPYGVCAVDALIVRNGATP